LSVDAFKVAAELDSGFTVSSFRSPGAPLTDPLIVADISGNGQINATDASLLAQFAFLMPVDQIPHIPRNKCPLSKNRMLHLQIPIQASTL
jgi:hypothetical protein